MTEMTNEEAWNTALYLIAHGMPGATATPFHTYTLPMTRAERQS